MTVDPPVHTTILFDIRSPEGGRPTTELIQAAIAHADYADDHGFTSISITEHHATDDGYMPSPIVFGAAVAAVTEKVLIRLGAVILPLHNPLRLAEDLAMLDLVSGGRLRVIVGIGYREREYLQLGIDKKRRVAILEEGVETLKQAWTGEPFEYQGRTVRVLPRPAQQPRPAIIMGGGAPATARRAARIADGFQPVVPEIYEQYLQELTALGKSLPGPNSADVGKATIGPYVFVSEDPDADWARVGPYALYDNNAYGKWIAEEGGPTELTARDVDDLRARGPYQVLTPDECVQLAKRDGTLVLKTLMGGMDPAIGFESLKLAAERVLPKLRSE
jgi:alkanesulfonate monooxygenase SsuD/methylene tetrahydromethanopterin reductase-like flavin-dependent oxidoreductase (luciferase family)